MFERSGGGLGHHVGQPGRRRSGMTKAPAPAACAVRMIAPRLCGSSTPSSTTTILEAAAASRSAYLRAAPSATTPWCAGVPASRSSDGARLEAHRHGGAARQVDDLLQARTAGALRNQDPVQRVARAQRLGHRVNAAENGHGLSRYSSGITFRPLLKRLVKFAMAATSVISTICSVVEVLQQRGAGFVGVGVAGQFARVLDGGALGLGESVVLLGLQAPQFLFA